MGHSEDRIHGGPDLVAHVGEEIGLGLGGGHGFFFGREEISFGLLAIGDVFGHVEEIQRISSSVPDDRKAAVCEDVAAIAADETLLILVFVALAFEEFRVSLCTPGAIVRVNDL